MTALEIARQLGSMGEYEGAIKAYGVVIHQSAGADPSAELEAALYILQNGGDYKVSYSCLLDLYRRGCFTDECLSVMTQAFYEPNVRLLKSRYQSNCKLLEKYPYIFRKDFIEFEFLPLRFYPYDDNRFVPYSTWENNFGEFVDLKRPVVGRNFFRDLDKPVLAPVLAGLVGLIPNCAGSVVITQLYLEGAMGLGAAMAGLLAGSGVGLLVLFRVNHNRRENLKILALLYCLGAAAGIVIGMCGF